MKPIAILAFALAPGLALPLAAQGVRIEAGKPAQPPAARPPSSRPSAMLGAKVPLPDGRLLQLLDVSALLPQPSENAPAPAAGAAKPRQSLADLASFLRAFAEPPLQPGDDIQPLGEHCLALLCKPEQAARVEELLHTATAKRNEGVTISIEVRVVQVEPAVFEQRVLPLLRAPVGSGAPAAVDSQEQGQARWERVFADDKVPAQILGAVRDKNAAGVVQAPRLVVWPLGAAHIAEGRQLAYVRDFNVEVAQAAFIADPVVDTILDGTQTDVTCAFLGKNDLAVRCEFVQQDVIKPVPEFTTSLGQGAPVSIQVPRTTGVRFHATAVLQNGGALVLAARSITGKYVLAILEAQKTN
jgi:hypothetical protein